MWPRWLHRRCERELEELRAQHGQWVKSNRLQWGAKNKAVSEAANQRVSAAAVEARKRIAAAQASIDAEVRRRVEHALHAATVRAAAARQVEHDAAFAAGLAMGRAEVVEAGPPVELSPELERLLTATPRGEECVKTRLNDREHAVAMVAHVLETSRVRTEPYQCPACPRQLFGRGRWWHVRTVNDPAERAKRDAMKNGTAKGSPDRMALRLSPEQRALLYGKVKPVGSDVDG